MKHEFSENWPEYHAQAEKKWDLIYEKVKNKEQPFSTSLFWLIFYPKGRVSVISVLSSCGYCKEFLLDHHHIERERCQRCPLFLRGVCCTDLRFRHETTFWNFVREMKKNLNKKTKNKTDWEKALGLAQKIRESIQKDKPSN